MHDPMTDGPNHHHFRTFTRGTQFIQSTVVYADGEEHTFHIPVEAYGPQEPIDVASKKHIESLEAELAILRRGLSEISRWCKDGAGGKLALITVSRYADVLTMEAALNADPA